MEERICQAQGRVVDTSLATVHEHVATNPAPCLPLNHTQGEEGIDAGGVSREWYAVMAREMFNPNLALFVQVGGSPVPACLLSFHHRTAGMAGLQGVGCCAAAAPQLLLPRSGEEPRRSPTFVDRGCTDLLHP